MFMSYSHNFLIFLCLIDKYSFLSTQEKLGGNKLSTLEWSTLNPMRTHLADTKWDISYFQAVLNYHALRSLRIQHFLTEEASAE